MARWIMECGCGRTVYADRGAYRVETSPIAEPCNGEHPESDTPVHDELGWCGCGTPEDTDRMMLVYLETLDSDAFPRRLPEGVSEDALHLLQNIADSLGWTEHGTTVGGAWLTEDGRTTLSNLRAARLAPTA
jgi:hypothetical protein